MASGVSLAPAAPESLRGRRNFWLVWLGQAISRQGDGIAGIAIVWWIVEFTGSPAVTTTLLLLITLPAVLLGPVAGALVDRVDRRRLLLVTDLVRGTVVAGLAGLILSDALQVWQLLVFGLVEGMAQTLHAPALQASIPRLVPPALLNKANSLNQMSEAGANLVAPVLGGALVASAGAGVGLALNALTYGAAAVTLLLARIPVPEGKGEEAAALAGAPRDPVGERPGLAGEALEGLRYLRRDQPMLFFMLCAFALVNFALAPVGPLLPFVARERLGLGATGYSVLTVALTVGTILGAAVVSTRGQRIRRGPSVIWGITGIGLGMAALGLTRSPVLAAAALAASGMGLALAQVGSDGLFQTRVPDRLRGRVFAVRRSLSSAAAPLSLALVGAASGAAAPHLILAAAGLLAAAGGLSGYLIRDLPRAE